VLEIDCVFGGVNLIVPADWVVHVQIDSVMGGFADKRRSNDAVRDHSRELLIKGSTVFGGGEIRSY
jgi:predicted membrane protein